MADLYESEDVSRFLDEIYETYPELEFEISLIFDKIEDDIDTGKANRIYPLKTITQGPEEYLLSHGAWMRQIGSMEYEIFVAWKANRPQQVRFVQISENGKVLYSSLS